MKQIKKKTLDKVINSIIAERAFYRSKNPVAWSNLLRYQCKASAAATEEITGTDDCLFAHNLCHVISACVDGHMPKKLNHAAIYKLFESFGIEVVKEDSE